MPFIKYYWYMKDPVGNEHLNKDMLIPDGSLGWVLNNKSRYNRFVPGHKAEVIGQSLITGLRSRTVLANRKKDTELVGIKLRPGSVHYLTGIPEKELKDHSLAASDVLSHYNTELEDRVFSVENRNGLKEILDRFFLDLFNGAPHAEHTLVGHITGYINDSHNFPSLKELHQYFNIHPKKLERLFGKWVGLGPKGFIKVVRFKRAYKLFNRRKTEFYNTDFYDLGYYDQMHFIKEFKFFTGQSPTDYYNGDSDVTDGVLLETLQQMQKQGNV